MKFIFSVSLLCLCLFDLNGQTQYERSCNELLQAAYQDEFNFATIEAKVQEVSIAIKHANPSAFESCNCADSVWVKQLQDRRRFFSSTHSINRDTNSFLRRLSIVLDVKILNQEFKFQQIITVNDSFDFVIERVKSKAAKRHHPKYNWMNFYHCVDAEASFLKENKYILKSKYFEYFDNVQNPEDIRDMIITSYFNSNETIEDEILFRVNIQLDQPFFYRMLGILRTSGTEKSVKHLLQLLKENNFNLNEKKSILQAIYGITDREKIKRKTRKAFESYLVESKLDSLSRYDLYIKGK